MALLHPVCLLCVHWTGTGTWAGVAGVRPADRTSAWRTSRQDCVLMAVPERTKVASQNDCAPPPDQALWVPSHSPCSLKEETEAGGSTAHHHPARQGPPCSSYSPPTCQAPEHQLPRAPGGPSAGSSAPAPCCGPERAHQLERAPGQGWWQLQVSGRTSPGPAAS